jgi:ABC-type transporter Mla subunit MlaD
VVQANRTGEASAERRGDLARSIHLLPGFLRELRPLMADLEDFTDQGTPLLTDLNAAAPALGRLIEAQGTLADASRDSFPSLGDALERGRPALINARPLIRELGALGREAAPVSVDLDELTKSLNKTGAIERLNDLIYYITLASNGFDGLGHYLRAGLVTNVCSTYALEPSPACRSTFFDPAAESSTAGGALEAANADASQQTGRGSVPPTGTLLQDLLGQGGDPSVRERREQNLDALRERDRQGRSPALDGAEAGLDYLLGSESR